MQQNVNSIRALTKVRHGDIKPGTKRSITDIASVRPEYSLSIFNFYSVPIYVHYGNGLGSLIPVTEVGNHYPNAKDNVAPINTVIFRYEYGRDQEDVFISRDEIPACAAPWYKGELSKLYSASYSGGKLYYDLEVDVSDIDLYLKGVFVPGPNVLLSLKNDGMAHPFCPLRAESSSLMTEFEYEPDKEIVLTIKLIDNDLATTTRFIIIGGVIRSVVPKQDFKLRNGLYIGGLQELASRYYSHPPDIKVYTPEEINADSTPFTFYKSYDEAMAELERIRDTKEMESSYKANEKYRKAMIELDSAKAEIAAYKGQIQEAADYKKRLAQLEKESGEIIKAREEQLKATFDKRFDDWKSNNERELLEQQRKIKQMEIEADMIQSKATNHLEMEKLRFDSTLAQAQADKAAAESKIKSENIKATSAMIVAGVSLAGVIIGILVKAAATSAIK